jgi:hypothetical protein
VAAPALAKTAHRAPAPAVQGDTRIPAPQAAVTPYAADLPQAAHRNPSLNPDFQLSSDK